MGIIIDGVIILFILVSVFLGYKKGLVSLGIHLVAFITALIVALILYRNEIRRNSRKSKY